MKVMVSVSSNMKFTITPLAMGMIDAANDEIRLVGGVRSGSSPDNQMRLKYMIYSNKDENGEDTEPYQVGNVELFVEDGVRFGVVGLVVLNIDKKYQRRGFGKKVLKSIVQTTGKPLEIRDIKKSKVSAWRKMGATDFFDMSGKPIKAVSKYKADSINAWYYP